MVIQQYIMKSVFFQHNFVNNKAEADALVCLVVYKFQPTPSFIAFLISQEK